MAKQGAIKRVFPGGNTGVGFHSFYDYIIEPDARRIMVIKGGPGVGKSTFMHAIGEAMVERGFDVEYMHCSSDNGSLDGVVVPEIGVAMIDGTAPHVVDPKNPGCVDEIIHLGDFWDESKMRAHKAEIMECNREVGRLFTRGYRFLRAAKTVHDDWEAANIEGMNFAAANKKAAAVLDQIFARKKVVRMTARVGKERHLFASAITPDGPLNYLETVVGPMPTKYVINGEPGTGKSTLVGKVAATAVEHGYDVEIYHCALDPGKVEHLIIPKLGVAVVTSAEPHVYPPDETDLVIDMNGCLSRKVVEKYADLVAYDREEFARLFDKAVSFIARAKKTHDKMESYYVPNMDFATVGALREKTLARILAYAGEVRKVV